MAQWKIYLKWQKAQGFIPYQELNKGHPVSKVFKTKEQALSYFNNSNLKDYNDEGWIVEYLIQQVSE